MKKIIFIAGLNHSGSTILDMALGSHPSIVGLGEIINLINAKLEDFQTDEFNRIRCSCGGDMNTCNFWKDAKKILIEDKTDILIDKYTKLVDYFSNRYGNEIILVDSSKNISNYLTLLNKKFDFRVIFLIRDCRGWCYSRHSRYGTNMIRLAYTWLKGNLKIKRFLKKKNILFKQFGYEEIALYLEIMLNEICKFAGLKFDPLMLEPDKTKSHIIRGNVVREDSKKRKVLMYDARWFPSIQLSIFVPLLLPALIWNSKNVYTNFIKGTSKAFGVHQKDYIIFGDAQKEKIRQHIE